MTDCAKRADLATQFDAFVDTFPVGSPILSGELLGILHTGVGRDRSGGMGGRSAQHHVGGSKAH